jgi:hypothetical protein
MQAVHQRVMGCKAAAAPPLAAAAPNTGLGHDLGGSEDRAELQVGRAKIPPNSFSNAAGAGSSTLAAAAVRLTVLLP